MKQYIITPRESETITEQIKRLSDQGATWFTLSMPQADADTAAAALREAIGACMGSDAILVVEGHVQTALHTTVDEARASGVIINAAQGHPQQVRELLGPHAIVGYAARTADEILPLLKLDIDYFTLPAAAMTDALAGALAKAEKPVVAVGADEVPEGFAAVLASA